MQEYNVIVEIDEDGNIRVETKGMIGTVCVEELDNILEGVDGEKKQKNKPEYYQKASNIKNKIHNKT